ncbi:MAG: UDP-3-O-(3-hydroxymyristoyl)glucosamine N-acyltransferase [Planctomycetota bacterium]
MPIFSARELADLLEAELIGPGDAAVEDVSELETAGDHDLAFLRDGDRRQEAEHCGAAVLITPVKLERFAGTQVVCADAEMAMATVLGRVAEARRHRPQGGSPEAAVSPEASLGEAVCVGAYAVVGPGSRIGDGAVLHPHVYIGADCRIGAGTVIHANASVHDRTSIGRNCIIQYNAAIGAEGFGFLQRDGRNVKVPQVGRVEIGDEVEIGSLTTVDRATLGATVIGDGTKIDDHCHVAHNCRIGAGCIMAGSAKLAGSVTLGDGVIVAEDVGVTDHVTVGDGAVLGGRSGVHADVEAGKVVLGLPARPIGKQRRIWVLMGRLPEMYKRLRSIQNRLEDIEERLENGSHSQ